MDPMYAAIKKRKSGGVTKMGDHSDMAHPSEHAEGGDETSHLHDFVSGLSEQEKHSLKGILEKDKATGQEIAKGGPSTDEKNAISGRIAEENPETDLAEKDEEDRGFEGPGHNPAIDSDAIGKSLLDSRYTGGNEMPHSRNLGERVKHSIATKLKAKGKI